MANEREREREGEIIRNDETAAHWRGRQKCTVSKSPRDLIPSGKRSFLQLRYR